MEEANISWKESTQKIFWGVIIIAVAGIINVLYDYVSYGVFIFEFIAKNLPNSMGNGMNAFFTSIHTLGFIAKLAVVIGYVLYLMGLTRFAAIQSNTDASLNIQKVRTAVIILICCFAAGAIFGVLFSIPFLGTIISIAVWIATLIAYFKMKNAFGILMTSPAFSATSQKGAKKLRYAALSNIRLMLMPIVVALIFVILALLAVAVLKGGTNPTGFLYVGSIVGVAAIICALVFMFFALVYPFIGWYQIMKGGPGEDSLIDATKIEQHIATMPTGENQMQALKDKGKQAKMWVIDNKKKIGIGAGTIAIIALLAWLLPKLFAGSPKAIEFERYEVEDDIQAYVDIPVGDSEKEQNVSKAICQLIASTHMAKELGAPLEGASPREVVDDYNKRFKKYIESFHSEMGSPVLPVCQLFIESDFQNEACVVFEVAGSIYMNGSPDTYHRIVRLSDGHIMELGEMVFITPEELETMIKKYNDEESGLPVYLGEGFNILPAANDSCRVTWPIAHGYGEVLIPLSEMQSHLTDEGKNIYMASPVDIPTKKEKTATAQEGEQSEGTPTENEPSEEAENSISLIGSLPAGKSEFVGEMAGFPIEFTIIKDISGVHANYKNVKFGATIKLESDGKSSDDGNTTFYGKDAQNNQWIFRIGGNPEYICGIAEGDAKELQVVLYKK